MSDSSGEACDATMDRLRRAAGGDDRAWVEIEAENAPRLIRIIGNRLDGRVRKLVEPRDVLQDVLVVAHRRLGDYLNGGVGMPFFLWMRWLVLDRLRQLHRKYVFAKSRDPGRERPLMGGDPDDSGALQVIEQLAGSLTTPSEMVMREEAAAIAVGEFRNLKNEDRAILELRVIDELTSREAARLLEITEEAAQKRYVRALSRLRRRVNDRLGGSGTAPP